MLSTKSVKIQVIVSYYFKGLIKHNMNSVLVVILLTFDACILTKYLLVEIPKIEREFPFPEKNQAKQFVYYNKNESTSDLFQSSQGLRPNGFSKISKASFGIK